MRLGLQSWTKSTSRNFQVYLEGTLSSGIFLLQKWWVFVFSGGAFCLVMPCSWQVTLFITTSAEEHNAILRVPYTMQFLWSRDITCKRLRARGIRRSTMSIVPRLLFRGRHCCQYVLPWTSGCDLGSQGGRH